jgi:putative methyltransferase
VTAATAAAASRLRCVRVNTLRTTVPAATAALRASFGADVAVTQDALLCDVLHLPSGTDVHAHALVSSGHLIQQGFASCLAAHALAPQPGWSVVDACAAPGNKTTHLAALMGGVGRVHAFDASPPRLARLVAASRAAGAERVIYARVADFLALDPFAAPLRDANALLLDPSCSGSGTGVTRGDALLPSAAAAAAAAAAGGGASDEAPDARVASLSRFQLTALRHALRCPSACRLVYSTCSIHVAENEGVVAAALPGAQALGWTLAPALPGWHRRGLPGRCGLDDAQAACLLRCDPLHDGCEGFFVALFVRDAPPRAPAQEKQEKQAARGKQAAGGAGAQQQAQQQAQAVSLRWVGGSGGGKAKKGKGPQRKPLFA